MPIALAEKLADWPRAPGMFERVLNAEQFLTTDDR